MRTSNNSNNFLEENYSILSYYYDCLEKSRQIKISDTKNNSYVLANSIFKDKEIEKNKINTLSKEVYDKLSEYKLKISKHFSLTYLERKNKCLI